MNSCQASSVSVLSYIVIDAISLRNIIIETHRFLGGTFLNAVARVFSATDLLIQLAAPVETLNIKCCEFGFAHYIHP